MTTREFEDNLKKIDDQLFIGHTDDDPVDSIYIYTNPMDNYHAEDIYDFAHNKFNFENCRKYIPGKVDTLRTLIFNFTHNHKKKRRAMMQQEIDDFQKNLIDNVHPRISLLTYEGIPRDLVVFNFGEPNWKIYSFKKRAFNGTGLSNLLNEIDDDAFLKLQKIINDYWDSKDYQTISKDSKSKNSLTMGSAELTSNDNQMIPEDNTDYANHKDEINKVAEQIKYVPMVNPFAKYTEKLATVLKAKNIAYGDSFTKSVDDYGLKVIGIRLSDKYNRVKHLVNHGLLKENDESLEDTLLDMAGYSILA